ncbi:hypothetical protein IQ269_17950 [Tychonema sp. LEGE 07199]|uniref:hypothetical protein n=1 Tax=unclassified Tychonema TaxID=2642144 RepID=UPI00187F0CFD|nr:MULTISPECIES: hypothetical protein [unclassified Tychonema]MBE9122631.1 hypothetical protein [Tychonema sp. LEGE 07199]MBE9131518.1 hypothetical protein [Tychonema sp. LEGE 07196]
MTDYNEVLQNPKVAFKSPELQSANIEQTPLGLPRLVSGGFALTACATQTTGHSNKWAIRCFHKEAPDLQERYQHISDFLQKQTDNFFVKFQYEPESILVRGTWYPIVKMAWVDGDSLNEYIEDNLNNPQHLRNLAEKFKLISQRLHELNMGHGDLQHGNILVGSNGHPILIDYDGMYVPTMPYKNSNEIGHINFQHPSRTGSFFNAQVDRFSLIILYVSLQALASDSKLWQKYHTGTNLIFSRKDYQDPNNSSLFSDLKNISQIDSLVSGIKNLCHCAVEDIPTLEDFLNPSITLPQQRNPASSANITGSTSSPAIIQTPFKIFAANDILKLVRQEGETITIVGRVVRVGTDDFGSITFINFGDFRSSQGSYKPFTIVVFSQGLAKIRKVKGWDSTKLESLTGQYVEITGLLAIYQKRFRQDYKVPQIIWEDPYQVRIISKAEADKLLVPPPQTPVSPTPTISTGSFSASSGSIPPRPVPPSASSPSLTPTPIATSTGPSSGSSGSIPPKPVPPSASSPSPTPTSIAPPTGSSSGSSGSVPSRPAPPSASSPSPTPTSIAPTTGSSSSSSGSVPSRPVPLPSAQTSSQTSLQTPPLTTPPTTKLTTSQTPPENQSNGGCAVISLILILISIGIAFMMNYRPPDNRLKPEKNQKLDPPKNSLYNDNRATSQETKLPDTNTSNSTRLYNFPMSSCGDSDPGYVTNWYPVYINYSERNLAIIRANYCRDAIPVYRNYQGTTSILVASFLNRSTAQEFANFMKTKVGSGKVGTQ